MRLRYALFASIAILGGCIGNMALDTMSASENNVYNLWRISKGMSQAQVLKIMHKPFEYETFEFDQDTYDVWFYITRVTALGQTRMVPQNLTPLTFKNGVLVDVGYVYYNYLVKEEAIRAKIGAQPLQAPAPKPEEAEENIELEKALQTPPGSPSAPAGPAKQAAPAQPATAKPTPQKQTAPVQSAPQKKAQPNQKTPATQQPRDQGQGYVPENQLPGLPSQSPSQPPNQLPGLAPAPTKAPSKTLSMSSKPKKTKSDSASQPESDSEPSKPNPQSDTEPSSDQYKWDSEDQRMQEEQNEQDFNYW